VKWYADEQNDRVRHARNGDADNYITRTEDAAWIQLMYTATCRCASAGNRAANARAELRKLDEEALRSAERLSRIMDEMPWSARQFREKAMEAHDLQVHGQRGEG
jgi:hypothetical protein